MQCPEAATSDVAKFDALTQVPAGAEVGHRRDRRGEPGGVTTMAGIFNMTQDEVGDAHSSHETRRAALLAAVAASAGSFSGEGATAVASSDSGRAIDPALLAWQKWDEAHQLRERLWSERQRLDTAVVGDAGILPLSDGDADALDEDLAAREDALAADLFATGAATVLGVIAKLDALLALMESGPECEDEPWPQIRAVLADLCRFDIDAALRG
jgi:hypothetical protein